MKILFIALLFSVGCGNSMSNRESPPIGGMGQSGNISKPCDSLPRQVIITKHVWKEYKTDGGRGLDNPPYPGCYIQIVDDQFTYIIHDTVAYVDTLIKKYGPQSKVFTFKNHTIDELGFLDKDSSEVLLKRNNYEGTYEYFRREPRASSKQ